MGYAGIAGGPTMTQAKQSNSGNWLQREILEKILEVKNKVDESLQLGRQNGEDIRTLRKELGVDGPHGRLPQLELAMGRLDRQQENDNKEVCRLIAENQDKTERRFDEMAKKAHDATNKLVARIEPLEMGEHETHGSKRVVTAIISFFSGSLGAALVGLLAKMMGIIH